MSWANSKDCKMHYCDKYWRGAVTPVAVVAMIAALLVSSLALPATAQQTPPAAEDPTLSALELSVASRGIGFASATTHYTTRVHQSVTETTVTATTRDPSATMTVGLRGATAVALASGTASSAIALSLGQNIIEVVVTTANATTKTYAVEVFRERSNSTDPRNVRLMEGSQRLTLLWDRAPGFTGPTNTYRVRWRGRGRTGWLNPNGTNGEPTSNKLEHAISNLSNDVVYSVQVLALTNGAAAGRWVEVLGSPSALNAPTGVTLTPGNGELTVTWDAPVEDVFHAVRWRCTNVEVFGCRNADGASILGSHHNGVLVQPNKTSYTITGLTNGRSYTVTVKARSSSGQGESVGGVSQVGTDWVRVEGTPSTGLKTYSLIGAKTREGDDAALALTLNQAAPAGGVTFNLVADFSGTASANDAGTVVASVTVPSGERSAVFTIPIAADSSVESSEAFTVTASTTASGWSAASTGANTATVTIEDGPTAAPKVKLAATAIEVEESGVAKVTVQIEGNNPRASEVTLTLTDGSASRGSDYSGAASATVFLPPGRYGVSKTLGIAIIDDATQEDDETFTVAITGVSEGHAIGTPSSATVTIAANDSPAGITVTPSTLDVPLDGTATYTVALDAEPTASVFVFLTSSNLQAVSISSPSDARLFFTTNSWDRPQQVTLSGLGPSDDGVTISHRVTSRDTAYSGITVDPVSATVTFRAFSVADVTVDESDDAEIVLTLSEAAPTGGLAFDVALGYSGANAASAQDLGTPLPSTVTVAEGETTARITVPLNHDDVAEGNETFSVTVSTSASGWARKSQGEDVATVTIRDDDVAGVTVTAQDPVRVDEGQNTTYSVVLNTRPTNPVTITPRSSDGDAVRTSGVVTFQPAEWHRPKQIAIYTVQDRDNVDERVTITHTASGATGYDSGLQVDSVTVEVNDDEPGVTVTAQDPIRLDEGQNTTYSVVLNTRPSNPVTITPRSSDLGAVRTSGVVTFAPAEWQSPKTITIYASQDDDYRDEQVTITHTAEGGGYSRRVPIASVTVEVDDDEAKSTDASLQSLSLSAGTASYDVTSFGETATVTWAVIFDTTTLTVTPTTNHDRAVVTVNGATVASGEASGAVTLNAGANTVTVVVTAEDGTTTKTYTLTVTRQAAPSELTLSASTASVSEDVGRVTITATIDNPAGSSGVPVTLTAASGSTATTGSDYTLPAQFSIARGQTSATAEVTVIDDSVDEASEQLVLSATTTTGISVSGVTVEITDNDSAALVFTAPPKLRMTQGGTAAYLVALATKPTANVTVTAASSDTDIATVSGALTFTPANYKTPQPVTVSGVKVATATVAITHTVTSDDTNYAGLSSDALTAIVENNGSSDAALESLTLSAAAPNSIDFSSAVSVYTVSTHHSYSSTTVTATTRNPDATMTVGLRNPPPARPTTQALTNGVASNAIALAPGQNIIDVVVTAPDGTKKTYTVAVTPETASSIRAAAPRNLRLVPGDSRLTLLWDHADPTKAPSSHFSDRYNIRWSVAGSGRWSNPNRATGEGISHNRPTEYSISGLTNGTEYAVHIQAHERNSSETEVASAWVKVFGTPGALDAPTGLTLTPGDGTLTVAWDAPSDSIFHALRWTCVGISAPGCSNPAATSILSNPANGVLVKPGINSYTITGLTNDLSYTVSLKARPSGGHGETPNSLSSVGTVWVAANAAPTDSAKTFAVSGATVREGDDAVLAVSLSEPAPSGGVNFAITADFSGTASEGDAGKVPFTVTVPDGQRSASFAIPILADTATESSEVFTVTVSANATGWAPAPANADTATVSIEDGPTSLPTVSLTNTAVTVAEDAGKVSLQLAILGNNPHASEVTLTLADGTATRGSDYGGSSATATVFVPARQKEAYATLNIPIIDDTDEEEDETFTVTITGVSASHSIGTQKSATVTISANDTPGGITLDPTALTALENTTKTYTVVLDDKPTQRVTVTPRSSNREAVTTSGAVTFVPSQWNTPKQITVYANKATDSAVTISHTTTSGDHRYDGLTGSLAVTVTSATSNAPTLSGLQLSAGTISPAFDASVTSYTLSVPNSATSTTVTATVPDSSQATIKAGLSGSLTAAVSGEATGAINLSAGANTVEVLVTAADTTTNTYTITVTRGGTGVPGAPSGLSVEAAPSALKLSWDSPADIGANALTGYDVGYKTASAADQPASTPGDPSTGWVDASHTGTTTAITISGLTNGTSYNVRVRATNGVSPGSAWASGSGRPVQPPIWITSATPGGPGEIIVKWSRGPGVDTSGNWRWRVKSPQGPWVSSQQRFRGAGVTLTGLTNGETYEIQVNGLSWRNLGTPSAWSPIFEGTAGDVRSASDNPKTFSVTAAASATEGRSAALTITLSENAPAGGVSFTLTPRYTGSSTAIAADVGSITSPVVVAENTLSKAFTVPLVDDDLDENDETFQIVIATSNTDWAKSVDGTDTATVTITDNDTAGVTVTPTTLAIDEGASKTYTVVLASQPTSNVVLALTNPDSGAVTVSPTSHTFTATNWSTAQTFTVAGVEENTDYDNETVTISHALTSTDTQYAALTVDSVTVTVTDNDDLPVPVVTSVRVGANPDGSPSLLFGYTNPDADVYEVVFQIKENSAEWTARSANRLVAAVVPGTKFLRTGLQKGTTYQVRAHLVVKSSRAVIDASSAVTTVTTWDNPDVVTGLDVTAGNVKLVLSWTAPTDTGGVALSGYDIEYKTTAATDRAATIASDPSTGWVATTAASTATSVELTGLANGTEYDVRVRAKNVAGVSSWVTGSGTPVDATNASLSSLQVTLTDVDNTAVALTPRFTSTRKRFTVRVDDDVAEVKVAVVPTVADATVTINGTAGATKTVSLEYGDNTIEVEVTAVDGVTTATYTITAKRAYPLPNLTSVTAGAASDAPIVTVVTTNPDTNAYTVAVQIKTKDAAWPARGITHSLPDGVTRTSASTDSNHVFTGLVKGTEYLVRAHLVTTGDTPTAIAASSSQKAFTAWDNPDAPGGPDTPVWSTTLTVDVDGSDKGCDNAPGGLDDCTTGLGSNQFSFAGKTLSITELSVNSSGNLNLTVATTGDVPVALRNAKLRIGGASGTLYPLTSGPGKTYTWTNGPTWTDNQTVTIELLAPSNQPTVTAGDQKLTVEWVAPADAGGRRATITGYDIEYKTSAAPDRAATGSDPSTGWVATTAGATATSKEITSLTGGTAYNVRVRAKNEVGQSSWITGSGTPTASSPEPAGTPKKLRFKKTKVSLSESRDGANHVVRVVRSGDISREVSFTLTFADGTATAGTDFRGDQRTLKINANKRHRDVLLPIINDRIDEADETFTVTLATTTVGYTAGKALTVTIVDDDKAGVKLSDTSLDVHESASARPLIVKEKETVTYKLKLTSKPTHDVTITATTGDASKIRLHRDETKTRTFTPDNWNKAQTLIVRAKPIGDATVTISHSVVSTDPKYDGIAIGSVTVTVEDVEDLPDAVNDLTLGGTGTSVTVTWTAPDNPADISRYYVALLPTDTSAGEPTRERRRPKPKPGETMSVTFNNLLPGATYRVSVRAKSSTNPDKGERIWTETVTIASPPGS